jgi:hypothetical protein
MSRVIAVLVAVYLALIGAAVAAGMAVAPHMKELYADVALDTRETRVPCEQRPTVAEARRVVSEHADLIRRIEAIHYNVHVELDETACPGRGTLVFYYGGHRHRQEIERLIGADTFFGVPYSLINW